MVTVLQKKQIRMAHNTITEKTVDTKTENGYTITYQTTVNSTYSKDGVLLSTKKDGPYEVSRVAATGETAKADQSKIASTLDGELSRVSAKVAFDTNKANEVLAKLNAERKNQGLNTLSMSASSEAYKIACIRAADMAIYDHSSSSPMYGDLNALVSRYHCTTSHASENNPPGGLESKHKKQRLRYIHVSRQIPEAERYECLLDIQRLELLL